MTNNDVISELLPMSSSSTTTEVMGQLVTNKETIKNLLQPTILEKIGQLGIYVEL